MRCGNETCQCYFTPQPKPNGYGPNIRGQALSLYLEGMSFRAIGRQLGVNFQSVINWVNAYHDKELPQQVEDAAPTQTIEVDELYTYVGKKSEKRSW